MRRQAEMKQPGGIGMSEVNEESILEYLKSMKFKRALFGVSKTDALLKMRELHQMYQQLIAEQRKAAEQKQKTLYEEKVAAVAKAFVDMQEKTAQVTAEAQKQAEQIVADAQKQADEKIQAAVKAAETLMDNCRRELEQAMERQLKEIREVPGLPADSMEPEQPEREAAAGGAKDDLPFTP